MPELSSTEYRLRQAQEEAARREARLAPRRLPLSPLAAERLDELLNKHRDRSITRDEMDQLDTLIGVPHRLVYPDVDAIPADWPET